MAINFPNNPSVGTIHNEFGKSWIFDGTSWVVQLTLPVGSATTLGAFKVGNGLSVNPVTGVLTVTSAPALVGISTTGDTIFNNLTVTNLNVTGTRYGELAANESTVGSSGFLYNVISFPREIEVTEHTSISPNMTDDITYVKNEVVVVNEDVDLTIATGDFMIFH
jgi:hypothetical protein|tara:strand:- start:4757 stop:5251 length:495 start_codon:yes stop_codon:yes gene_type:complete